jgi:hypothetical protein
MNNQANHAIKPLKEFLCRSTTALYLIMPSCLYDEDEGFGDLFSSVSLNYF